VDEFDEFRAPFRFPQTDTDELVRAAAFAEINRLSRVHGNIPSDALNLGFQSNDERIPYVNRFRGIFKPRQMQHLLSIRTVFPRKGGRIWYDDQRDVHRQIYSGDEAIDYAYMGQDAEAAENRWLRDACYNEIPIIYFLGTAPGLYQAIVPAFIVDIDPVALKARVAFAPAESAIKPPRSAPERRYALRAVKQRLHQASFREMLLTAYSGKCAISRLPEPLLLDGAHIIEDTNEASGQPVIGNGILLSKIHHAAFDKHLIGIDPDFWIHVSEKLLRLRDGPTIEALRQFDGSKIRLPRRVEDNPDKDRLAMRFEKFLSASNL
jgi:putative restriction endonuclease